MDNSAEIAAEHVRHTLTTRGYPPARTARTNNHLGRTLNTAGYTVTPGPDGHGPRVEWDQQLTDDELWAKLEELRVVLGDAGIHAEWIDGEWALEADA